MADVSLAQLKELIAAHAAKDADFRAALLADPKAEVQRLLGTDLPAHVKIQAIEEAPNTFVVVVPSAAASTSDAELSDADLEHVAGGAGKTSTNNTAKAYGSATLVLPTMGVLAGARIVEAAATVANDQKTADAAHAVIGDTVTALCGWM